MNTRDLMTIRDDAGKTPAADQTFPGRPPNLGEAILLTMGTAATASVDRPSPDVTTGPRFPPETTTAIVDQILVTPTKGEQVIHLKLREDLIPGTEIHLSSEGTELNIRLKTDGPVAYQFLREHLGRLRQQLRDHMPENTSIRLSLEQADREQNQGRSKGYRSWPEEWSDE